MVLNKEIENQMVGACLLVARRMIDFYLERKGFRRLLNSLLKKFYSDFLGTKGSKG
jgi:hypothetical protein